MLWPLLNVVFFPAAIQVYNFLTSTSHGICLPNTIPIPSNFRRDACGNLLLLHLVPHPAKHWRAVNWWLLLANSLDHLHVSVCAQRDGWLPVSLQSLQPMLLYSEPSIAAGHGTATGTDQMSSEIMWNIQLYTGWPKNGTNFAGEQL